MLRTILAVVIAAHGIGHILFLVPLLGFANWGQSTQSWLLTNENVARFIGTILWLATLIGFGIAVYGLWTQVSWWRSAAIVAAVVSTIGLILFWSNPVTTPVVSALAFNLIVLGALLLLHWPTVEAVGA